MNKKGPINYAAFAKAANEIKASGQTPSVRLVRSRLGGGSNSTLVEYIRHWHSENALASTVDDNISEPFKQALLAEFGRVVKNVRDHLEEQLSQERTQAKETNDLLSESEARTTELEEQLKEEKQESDKTILQLEKQLAAMEERSTELQRQIDKLEEHLKESVIAQELARTESAKAQIQLERADKTAEKSEKRMEELNEKIAALQESAHRAEIKAAVAEARVAELSKKGVRGTGDK
jgi:chromosome segregation ATPase